MDEEAIWLEEEEEALESCERGLRLEEECRALEGELMDIRNGEVG